MIKKMSKTAKTELAITKLMRGKRKLVLKEAWHKIPKELQPFFTFGLWNLCNRGELKRVARGVYRR